MPLAMTKIVKRAKLMALLSQKYWMGASNRFAGCGFGSRNCPRRELRPAHGFERAGNRRPEMRTASRHVTLSGAFVTVIGIAYGLIARGNLRQNADLILVGVLYKLACSATVFYYWIAGGLPHIVFAILGVADAVFFILMMECYLSLKRTAKT